MYISYKTNLFDCKYHFNIMKTKKEMKNIFFKGRFSLMKEFSHRLDMNCKRNPLVLNQVKNSTSVGQNRNRFLRNEGECCVSRVLINGISPDPDLQPWINNFHWLS